VKDAISYVIYVKIKVLLIADCKWRVVLQVLDIGLPDVIVILFNHSTANEEFLVI